MKSSYYIVLLIIFSSFSSYGQGIQDSIFEISSINILGDDALFITEEAGMKESHLDTLILKNKSEQSLADLLSTNTPIFIKSLGRGALSTASLRGTAASHTKVNWNGISINSPMLGMVDFSQIPVFLIDDISLKYGNSSLSEQGGGMGGTINLDNKANWDNRFSGKYLQGIGSYTSLDEFLTVAAGNNRFQSKTRLYHNYSRNDYTYTNKSNFNINYQTGELTHPLDTNKNASYLLYGLQQEFYLKIKENQFISFKYWGQHSERSIPLVFSNEGPQDSNQNKQESSDQNIVTEWNYYGKKAKITAHSGLIHKNINYEQLYLVSNQGMQHSVYSLSEQTSSINAIKYKYTDLKGYILSASIDANFHKVSTSDSVSHTGYNKNQQELSFYTSLQKQYFKHLNANLMLRQDLINNDFIPLCPLLGFDYKISKDEQLILKGNIARNYHSPSLNDKYWQPGGNADLKAEEGYSTELGLEFKRTIKDWYLKGEITSYYSLISNWILWLPDVNGYWEPINIRTVESKGIEINAKIIKNIGSNTTLSFIGNYAYTSSTNQDAEAKSTNSYGKQLVYIPIHSGNLMTHLRWKSWQFSWQHSSYGIRYTTTSNDPDAHHDFPAYFMNNMAIKKSWMLHQKHLNTQFKVNNLLNENYRSALYHPMPGRNYQLLISISF